jgi:Uma2 family endonuclease
MGRDQRGHAARAASLLDAIDAGLEEAISLARWMAANPEPSLQEFETSRRYVGYLRERDFEVMERAAGLETAFVAQRGSPRALLRVALLAEMDALPDIGHGCGHNLSGPASLLAASALASEVDPEELALVVVGCPGEEIGAGKRKLVEAGVFTGLDAALMAHASDMRRAHRLFLGNRKLEFTFHGRAAHAAAYPERGVNALDAVILLFNGVSLLRQQLSGRPCAVYSSDLRIRVRATGLGTYPDVTVVCGKLELEPEDPRRQTVINPSLVVEVLSPSTRDYDSGEKLEHYRRIESLTHVVLVAHDERRMDVWTRDNDTWSVRTCRDNDVAELRLLGCELP